MPDPDQILLFLLQVLETPVTYIGTFLGAIGILLLVILWFKERLQKWLQ